MATATWPPIKQNVKYVSVIPADTHSKVVGYLLWLFFGLVGGHRFYYGRPLSGVLWFFTLGLLGIGWLIDLFLIPGMDEEADLRFQPGATDYNITWVLLWVFGVFGLHRLYQGKIITGILFALTGGLFLIGFVYDVLTLNEQISDDNARISQHAVYYQA